MGRGTYTRIRWAGWRRFCRRIGHGRTDRRRHLPVVGYGCGGVKVIHPSLGGRPQERRLGDEHPQVLSSQAGQCQVGGALLRTPLGLGAYVPTPPDLLENKQPPIDFCRLRQ